MKVLCSQEVVSPHVCGAVPCQVTAKASAPQVPWFVLRLWLQKGLQENMAWFEHIDFYVFSCSSFRKPARNLIEIAQRKSHPLEDSCQEATPLLSTTFDSFFRLRCARHTPPALWPQTRPCFPCCGVGCLCAAPVTHQAQGSIDVPLASQTSAPGTLCAPENPRFPAVSNRVQRPDRVAPSRVQLL
jgi:hypothetical protein